MKMEAMDSALSMTRSEENSLAYSEDTAYVSVEMDGPASAADVEVLGPLTEPLERYFSKDLRKEVSRYKLRVTRRGPGANDHKNGYMELLRAYWRDHPEMAPRQASPPEELDDGQSTKTLPLLLPRRQAPPEAYASPSESLDVEEMADEATAHQDLEEMEQRLPLFEDKMEHHQITQSSTRSSDEESDGGDSMDDEDSFMRSEESEEDPGSSSPSAHDGNLTSMPAMAPLRPPRLVTKNDAVEVKTQALGETGCDDEEVEEPSDGTHQVQSLDGIMKHTQYWESRLRVSKRRLSELYGELQEPMSRVEADLLKDELTYYARERKRALKSLLSV